MTTKIFGGTIIGLGLLGLAATSMIIGDGDARADSKSAHWSYEGNDGPAHWGDLSAKFAACKSGRMQSPIDLAGANQKAGIVLSASYHAAPLTIGHNGHTVQIDVPKGATLQLAGKTFHLLQFHFHTPSEHVISGKPYPMEAHFVHAAEDGSLAVIGAFFTEGAESAGLTTVFDNLPATKQTPKAIEGASVDPAKILPENAAFYRYMGSLTTPPCSEGVHWVVVEKPLEASREQLAAMTRAIGPNARPAQPVNNRLVVGP